MPNSLLDTESYLPLLRELSAVQALMKTRGLPVPTLVEVQGELGLTDDLDYSEYQDDPIRFGEEVLGHHYTDDIKTMFLSVRDNEVTIARSANSTGKTYGAGDLALWFMRVYPDAQVWTTAAPPFRNLETLLWGQIRKTRMDHPEVFADFTDNHLNYEREKNPNSLLTGVAIPASSKPEERKAKFSGRHAPHIFFIVDEGDGVPAEIFEAIESCLSGGHVRLLILINPRAKRGPVYKMEMERQARVIEMSAFNHPNVREGTVVIPGAVERGITVRRMNDWSRPLGPDERPDQECYLVPHFLVGVTAKRRDGEMYPPLPPGMRKITNPALGYMVLARYPAQDVDQLINEVWIDAAFTRWLQYVSVFGEVPPAGVRPILGLDVAEMGNDSNVATLRYGGWTARQKVWNGMRVNDTARRTYGIYQTALARIAFIDATGLGTGIAPTMEEMGNCRAIGVMVGAAPTRRSRMGSFARMTDQLAFAVRDWLENDAGAMLAPDDLLKEELLALKYWVDGKHLRVTEKDDLREILRRSPDRFDSLKMTFAPEPPALPPSSVPRSHSQVSY